MGKKNNQPQSRTAYAFKNVSVGYICTFATYLLSFITRTALVKVMGENYVGINGLFISVLGVLSFAELGIGTALNFSLYKPVAENNTEKIKSLMHLYKRAYQVIAAVITILGMVLIPFLHFLVKDSGDIGDIRIYYCVFLFNTVTSYFVSYKYSLVNARQENYVFSMLNMITKVATSIVQIVALYAARNYLAYLFAGAAVDLVQKIWVSVYLNKQYPLLAEKNVEPLEKEEKKKIKRNVGALVWHKVGDVCVHQTDNILVSTFINVATVGKVTYYTMFVDAANQILAVAFNSVIGSLGNAISQESKTRQYELFKIYRFVAFWLYGFLSIGLYVMLSKLVRLLVGADMMLPNVVIFLILLNFYMMGHRIAVNNMKVAGGVFQQDQYVALLQAVVNLITSIIFVKLIGLPGIYVGTIIQGTLATFIKPAIVYRTMFERTSVEYFVSGAKYLVTVLATGGICVALDKVFFSNTSWTLFIIECLGCVLVVNAVFGIVFFKSNEFHYVRKMLVKRLKRNR